MVRRSDEREERGRAAPRPEAPSTAPVADSARASGPWSVPPQDLSKEWELRECARIEFAGARRPVVGGSAYPLLARIGHGGMGVVYFGFHPGFEIEVAIKILPLHLVERSPGLRRRFVREGRLAAELPASDHLVRVFDVGKDAASGLHFLVMEYVRGIPAGKWLGSVDPARRKGIAEDLALDVCIAATRGLCVFHEHGAIHRDIKPDNILIPERAKELALRAAKLSDLGLARPDAAPDRTADLLTSEGMTMMGTPGFAAPEQLSDPAGAKKPADVFSMGATLYAFLTGRGPFSRGGAVETLIANGKCEYEPLSAARPDVSAGTAAVVDLCLRKEPADRYPDAFALLDALLLCRRALGASQQPAETTAEVRRIAQRSEFGDAVRSPSSFASSVVSTQVRIEGGAAGAQVTMRRRGEVPLTYAWKLDAEGRCSREHVEPGVYEISSVRPGFHAFAGEVEIRPGECAVLRLEMREKDGRLSADSDPANAQVSVDGVPVGETPLRGLSVAPGPHVVTLSCRGHEPLTRNLVVRGDETHDLGRLALTALGALDVSGLEADVSVELDGRPLRGRTDLRPGEYVLVAHREGYEPQDLAVSVRAGSVAAPSVGPWRRQSWTLVSDLERWDATTDADRRRVARAIAERLPGFELRAMEIFESGGSRHEVAVLVHRPTGLEFALVPGGVFPMGSDAGEPGRRSDERLHDVRVGPFLMARTPVPQAVFESAAGANPSRFRGPALPVERVSWDDAAAFCERAGFTLPTEAQWEYACRAGTRTRWAAGDDPAALDAVAWHAANAADGPRPVGSRRPNGFGLFDLHGNVWEWCADAYAEYPFESVDDRTAELAVAGASGSAPAAGAVAEPAPAYRVFRGGSWCDPPERLRSALRAAFRPSHRDHDLGFRPVVAVTADLFSGAHTPLPRAAPPRAPTAVGLPGDVLRRDLARWDAATTDERRRAAADVAAAAPGFSLCGLMTFEAGGQRHEVAVFSHAPTGLEFVLVPGTPPLLVARTPVTQSAWRRVVGTDPSSVRGDEHPVEQVSSDEAEAFCTRTGLALPAEEHWERAARGGVAGPSCFGSDASALDRHAWIAANSGGTTHPVAQKPPNAFGLFDVLGNVWEWCRDAREESRATGSRSRAIRGGAFTSEPSQARCDVRLVCPPSVRWGTLGFRPVKELGS